VYIANKLKHRNTIQRMARIYGLLMSRRVVHIVTTAIKKLSTRVGMCVGDGGFSLSHYYFRN
jgi:hypothetical protein